jgi:hypothetical protein
MNMPENKEPKKYKVLCWGDCEKFPELGKCTMHWADKNGTPQKAEEGDVRADLLTGDIKWLLEGKFIEEVK